MTQDNITKQKGTRHLQDQHALKLISNCFITFLTIPLLYILQLGNSYVYKQLFFSK